jgi:hypothetical protein
MTSDKAIDIYVVSYNHEDFICRNISLIRRQNPDTEINWYIGVTGCMESFLSIRDDPLIKIISDIRFAKDNQHMRCMLHLLSTYGRSRYKLMLDPDFYLIQDNWVSQCIAEMEAGDFGCIATQWHPLWRKQRWGLAPHFLLYDSTRITIKRKDVFPTRSFRAIYSVDSGVKYMLLKVLESLLSYSQRLDHILTGGRLMRVSDTCAGLSWRLKKDNIAALRLGIHFNLEGTSELDTNKINSSCSAGRPNDYLKRGWGISLLFADSPYGPHYWTFEVDKALAKYPGCPELHYLGNKPFGVHARRYGRGELSICASDLQKLVGLIREID